MHLTLGDRRPVRSVLHVPVVCAGSEDFDPALAFEACDLRPHLIEKWTRTDCEALVVYYTLETGERPT